MKMLMSGAIAALAATAAFAQAQPASPPADPMATPPAAGTMTPTDTPAPIEAAAAPRLVEKDGVWWNGDRRATPVEIAEYKRNQPR